MGLYGNNNGGINGGMGTYGSGGQGYGLGGGSSMGGAGNSKAGMMGNGNGSMQSLQSSANQQQQGYAPSPTMGSMAGGQMAPLRTGTPLGHQQSQPKLSNGPSGGPGQSIPPQSLPSSIPSSQPQQQQQVSASAPAQQPPQVTTTSGAPAAAAGTNPSSLTPPFKMKASFSYSASPDDPNEISFVKGEILTILDNSGKWFNAQKMDGSEGIVPR